MSPKPVQPASAPALATPAMPVVDADEAACWALLDSGDWAAANARFAAVLAREPDSLGAAQGLVATLRKQRDFDAAARALDAALRRHPDALGLLAERVWCALDQKRDAEASTRLDEIIATGRADEGHYLWKVELLRRERRFEEAEAVISLARARLPGATRLSTESAWLSFHRRDHEEALRRFEEVLKSRPDDASAWQGRIASLRKLERFAEAREVVVQGMASCADAVGLLVEKGWTAFDEGWLETAERAFATAVRRAPADPRLKVCLAAALVCQRTEDDHVQAEALCREALKQEPDLADAFGCLGQIAFQRGRWSEAERQFRRAAELDTVSGRCADLGTVLARMGRTVDAQKYFRRAIEIDPDDVFAHLQLGSLLLTQDKAKLAIAEFNQALALAPRNPDAHRAMAVGLIELGRLDEAELILRRGLRDVDVAKSGTLHLTLAQLLARQGENASDNKLIEEALKEVGLALKRQPRSCAALFQRGLIRAKLGDLRGALQSFQQVLALDRHHLQAELNRQQVAALLRQERKLTGASRVASVFLCVVLLMHLGALWWLFIASDRVSATVFAALLPLLLGLLVVACLLPWLSRLKLTGLEAELSVPKAKDTLASGPKGALRFGDETPKSL